jgi:hypothetical protein
MPWCGCGIFFELKKAILFNDFGGVCSRLDGIWWLYKLPITDDDEYWEDGALPVPPEPPLDAICG